MSVISVSSFIFLTSIHASANPCLDLTSQIQKSSRPYPIYVKGGDERSLAPEIPENAPVIKDKKQYGVTVVGGGLAGLTSALYLAEAGIDVLIVEREPEIGGLAVGTGRKRALSGRGAAYWTEEDGLIYKILEHIGMKSYKKDFAIPEPIDSEVVNGRLNRGVWEKETLKREPPSFELFKHELEMADNHDLLPDQPIEKGPNLILDTMTALQFIQKMPEAIARRKDPESRRIYERYINDKNYDPKNPMKEIIEFLNLYCRSALGTTTDIVNALGFAQFYIAELSTRYTGETGTGEIAQHLFDKLMAVKERVTIRTEAPVGKIAKRNGSYEVSYLRNGKVYQSTSENVVFAAPVKVAPKIIENFAEDAPEKMKIIEGMKYTNYTVVDVETDGHPYRASYDTWIGPPHGSTSGPTDVILGRYMDPKIHGYLGMRSFKKNPKDKNGIFTIYVPMTADTVGKGYTKSQTVKATEDAIAVVKEAIDPIAKKTGGAEIRVNKATAYRYAYSIPILEPGFFTHSAPILRKPVGKIFFAHIDQGAPSIEEALYSGFISAQHIIESLYPSKK